MLWNESSVSSSIISVHIIQDKYYSSLYEQYSYKPVFGGSFNSNSNIVFI